MFRNKTLLICGGTGSLGNTAVKFLINNDIKEIRIFSRDEKKQDNMRRRYRSNKLKFYIGDIRDKNSLKSVMYGVDYVLQAAALKQVPTCEFFPIEALKTNVLGTDNILEAAIENGVKKVICLSTDKATYPINAMGVSKALMEKVVIAKARTVNHERITFCCTRYGNVMASRGSVIPIFIKQIKSGEPITITDPKMTRFLMSLDEAFSLIDYAFQHSVNGDIFVQKSPASTIGDLAQALKEIFNAGNEIRIIGTRHGEKRSETLLTKEEYLVAEDLGKFYRVPIDSRDLNYNKYLTKGDERLNYTAREYTSDNTEQLNVEQIKSKLLSIDYVQKELKGWN